MPRRATCVGSAAMTVAFLFFLAGKFEPGSEEVPFSSCEAGPPFKCNGFPVRHISAAIFRAALRSSNSFSNLMFSEMTYTFHSQSRRVASECADNLEKTLASSP